MKKKRQARESRNHATQTERRNRIRALLVQLGIWDELTDPRVKDYLLKAYYPPIELSVSEQVPTHERIWAVLRDLRRATENATFDCPLLGKNYSIVEYFKYVMPLADRLYKLRSADVGPALIQKLDELNPLDQTETYKAVIEELYYENLGRILRIHGRIDGYLYWLDWNTNWTTHGRLQQQLTLSRVRPEERSISKDGERRRVYRCGFAELNEVEWTEWRSSTLGLKDEDKVYPVFVQRHVLERLKERGGQVFVKSFEGHLHFRLAISLRNPIIHSNLRNDGAFLVEYHLGKYKIGYLVVRKLDDLILVESFLFLTMDGTPEGIQLKKQLRLDRSGKEYTGLDDLWTFLGTDLALDPDLVKLFEKCGCGHLFEMSKDLRINKFDPGYAADIRKYLKLKP
jgi:hypothetical protein